MNAEPEGSVYVLDRAPGGATNLTSKEMDR
jgi:hypothetical protein